MECFIWAYGTQLAPINVWQASKLVWGKGRSAEPRSGEKAEEKKLNEK